MSEVSMVYTIEKTCLSGWMSYRYQYQIGPSNRFGYAETQEEALEEIKAAGVTV